MLAAWPRPTLTVALGALAGLRPGILVAFAFQALDPRLRREEQLRALYRRADPDAHPGEPGRSKAPLTWSGLSPPAVEAYRTLRATLTTARHDERQPTSILVTGSSPSEGKTTTAVSAGDLAGRLGGPGDPDRGRPAPADDRRARSGSKPTKRRHDRPARPLVARGRARDAPTSTARTCACCSPTRPARSPSSCSRCPRANG